jgi:hypothetical protein
LLFICILENSEAEMLRRYLIVAAGFLALIGLVFAADTGYAKRGGFGGGVRAGGFGHVGGFKGFHAVGGARLGRMHVARAGRTHFTRGFQRHAVRHVNTRNRIASRSSRIAKSRIAAHRLARNARANRLARNAVMNRRHFTALGNRNRTFAALGNRNLAAAGRQGLVTHAGSIGRNAFAHARFGGFGDRGFRHFWAGGVFWPFFFGDFFSFALWPFDFSDAFWGWGPDVLLWSAFWPYYDYPYSDYGYYAAGYTGAYVGDIYAPYRHAGRHRHVAAPRHATRVAGINPQEAAASCAGFAPGVNDVPLERIEAIVGPAPDQRQAFEDFKIAVEKASDILRSACPDQTPLTAMARLDAMALRLHAMRQAEDIVREPLERLYGLLSAEQRHKLDMAGSQRPAPGANMDLAKLCSSQAGFTDVPADDIARTIKLDTQQMQDLSELKQASAKAAGTLRDSCPANVPETLGARLDAAQKRIDALLQAIETVRPKVQTFFASLSNVQQRALNSNAPGVRTASRRR